MNLVLSYQKKKKSVDTHNAFVVVFFQQTEKEKAFGWYYLTCKGAIHEI